MVVANFPQRKDARFTGLASAAVIVKLDRDDPQFQDIPNVSFFIEGRKVHQVVTTDGGVTFTLTPSKSYTANPAFCLLDYLMDDLCGKALVEAQIDLKSFYDVSVLCDKIVQLNASVGGKIWQPTSGLRAISRRNLPLYECNLIVDVTKTVRDNVETILGTMGDARLLWSGGKYKLSLQYPGEL